MQEIARPKSKWQRYIEKSNNYVRNKAYRKRFTAKLNNMWREGITNRGKSSNYWTIAEKHAPLFLEREGFEQILHIPSEDGFGIFDFLAKRDSKVCCFEVTTAVEKTLRLEALKFSRYLELTCYILFIKPNLTAYCLKRVPDNFRANGKQNKIHLGMRDVTHLKTL